MTVPSVSSAPAPTMELSPISHPSITTAPMPIMQFSPIVAPCTVQWWASEV